MIINGLSITVIGMSIVFVFLVILVLAMMFLNLILRKFFPKTIQAKTEKRKSGARVSAGGSAPADAEKDDLAVVAAAVAAIKAHIATSRG